MSVGRIERDCLESFDRAMAEQDNFPSVVYSERAINLRRVMKSGLYVDFDDFRMVGNTMRKSLETRVTEETMTNIYHTLIIHFAQTPELQQQAEDQLRYNPNNHSHWNRTATTYDYALYGQVLLPNAEVSINKKDKIQGIGVVGRRVIRAVMLDEIELPAPPEQDLELE